DEVVRAWVEATEDEKDRLFDYLLMEALLLDRRSRKDKRLAPPECADGARRASRDRPASFAFRLAAAAAILVISTGVGWYLLRAQTAYPAATVGGSFVLRSVAGDVVTRDSVLRGERIAAGSGGAQMSLGGYCELSLDDQTILALRGEREREVIELLEGVVVSRIRAGKGEFEVLTPLGTVVVQGTEFVTSVKFQTPEGGSVMNRLKKNAVVTVAVVSGLVAYHFGEQTGYLSGGMNMAFAGDGVKTIAHGKPALRPKTHKAWKDKGRIVGLVRNSPGFEVAALDAKGKVVASAKLKQNAEAYELEWLQPGVYTLKVSAKGYQSLVMKALEVKARNDLRIDLEF
ncbi:MAG: FecR domain-containing protein, partial [Planctomycetota bacterium]|nr:FecR domain-containing protein [Planctomycetota bacterium]